MPPTEDSYGGTRYSAAISLGRRSTFYEAGWELLETHLLDFSGDLYGSTLRVEFTDHIRAQQRFSSVDELKAQLANDIALVRELDPLAVTPGAGRKTES